MEGLLWALHHFINPLKGFEIAGKDGVFYPAEARITNRKLVEVWNDGVKEPEVVRYCYKNYIEGTLFGVNGMPVSSFTTKKIINILKNGKK